MISITFSTIQQDDINITNKDLRCLFQTGNDFSKKLAVKDCEMRKKEAALRRYQVATEKLSQFVEASNTS